MGSVADKDLSSLKLTVDKNGVVWYLVGDQMPYSSKQDIHSFLKCELWRKKEIVRIPGSNANAELLKELYEKRIRGEFKSLETCSYACCDYPEDREDPETLLYNLRRFNLASSLGGWHEFSIKDYPAYALASHFKNGLDCSEYTRKLIQHHPTWNYISFVEDLDDDSYSKLIALILDPRWFIDASYDPTRGSKLEQFLGLSPKTQESPGSSSVRNSRYNLVLDCWKKPSKAKIKPDGPRNFLWRIWANKFGGEKGDLTASRVFITFVRLIWTTVMCEETQAGRLFVPHYFFAKQDESDAFCDHVKKFSVKK